MTKNRISTFKRFWIYLFLAAILMQIPFVNLPFLWASTFYHELSHGIATLVSGGSIRSIELLFNGAGYCYSYGGWPIVIAFSGYFGAPVFGLLLFKLGQMRNKAAVKITSGVMVAITLTSLLLWASGWLTILFLIIFSGLLLASLRFKNANWLIHFYSLFGMTIMLNGVVSSLELFGLGAGGDAKNLSQLTLIPATVWVIIWVMVSVGCIRLAYCWSKK